MSQRLVTLILSIMLIQGCVSSKVPFQGTELIPVSPMTTAALVGHLWSSGSGRYLIRQSALFEFQGSSIPIEGMMRLDLDKKQGRLVAMNEMGVKLFDLVVDPATSESLFVIPELMRYPGFTEAVAISVRRIFLSPGPSPDDTLVLADKSYLLTRTQDNRTLRFVLGGRDVQMIEKSSVSSDEAWRVRYFEFQQDQQLPFLPRGIVLDDERAGYRLTLWLESVEKTDE